MTIPARASCAWRSQWASLRACQTPPKLGLPSAVRAGRTAWPPARVTETEMIALTAAAVSAVATIRRLNHLRMMSSRPLSGHSDCVGRPAFGEHLLVHAHGLEQRHHPDPTVFSAEP